MAEREAWIIDGVRTPRGKGKADGGLHGIHPQALLAQCLNAMAGRCWHRSRGGGRRHHRQRQQYG